MATIGGSDGSNIAKDGEGDPLAFATLITTSVGSGGPLRLEIDARAEPGGVQLIVAGAGPTYSGHYAWGGGSVAYSGIESFTVHSSAGSFADEVRTGAGDDVFHHYGLDDLAYQMDVVDLGGGANDLLVADFSAVTGHAVSNRAHPDTGSWYLFDVGESRKITYTGVERLRFIGGAQDDHVTGHEGNDVLEGRAGNDRLTGGAGDDDLSGGTGSNTIVAGDGDDIVRSVSFGLDSVLGGAGNDTAIIDYSGLTMAVTNVGGGDLSFGNGTDTAVVLTDVERIVITTGSGSDWILTLDGDDDIRTGAGADSLDGAGGDDRLDGGSGIDSMTGGDGDDTFVVDEEGDSVIEQAGGGTDRVLASSAIYALPDHVENLSAVGDGSHQFRGNALDNFIQGGAGRDNMLLQDGGVDSALGYDGDDLFYFGDSFTGIDWADGGYGRDVVVLQGNYALTLSGYSLSRIESISLQSGANTRWGDTANNFYDYDLAVAENLVSGGQQLIINGQSLREGEDLTFDGSAESNGKFLIYAGHGVDTLTGGDGADIFFFEGSRWGPSDSVDGGDGRDAVILSGPSGLNRYVFGADSFANIEAISVNARFASDPRQSPAYELVLHNANVAPGGTLIVNGSSLGTFVQYLRVDGSAVEQGNLLLIGGIANDRLKGGGGDDVIIGGGGSDSLYGGGGNDIFRYDLPTHSGSPAGIDGINDFVPGEDRIDLSRIDANSHEAGDQAFRWIGTDAFTGAGASSAGELRATLEFNRWVFRGDINGDGTADFAIAMHPITESESYMPSTADLFL